MSYSKSAKEEARVKAWQERVDGGTRVYTEWADRFKVNRLEEYYEGYQWAGQNLSEEEASKRYVVNLIYASVESQKPGLLFHKPQVKIKARPTRQDDLTATGVEEMANLCQNAVQTFIERPDVKFMFETGIALHEAHSRFGVVEVGYTADFIDNPKAGRPLLMEKDPEQNPEVDLKPGQTGGELPDAEGAVIPQPPADPMQITHPERIPTNERLYIKRIPAKDFRVSISDKNALEDNDWVGYCEWHYVEDLKRNPAYKNTRDLKATNSVSEKYQTDSTVDEAEKERRHGMVKIWKIWDLRTKTKMVIAEGHKRYLQEGVAFKYLPFADLKFLERPNHYYPMPVTWNWLGPQDEVNDQRDQRRLHRKRFTRRYLALKGGIEAGEMDKLETGGDGVWAWAERLDSIAPVPDAQLDGAVFKDAADTRQDFIEVSGVSSEARGLAESNTATQANILNSRMELRESQARSRVQDWLGRIARLMLLTLKDKMALPFMISLQTSVKQGVVDPAEIEQTAAGWSMVQATDLGQMDMDVSIELASLSPVAEQEERASWSQVLALLSNQSLLMILGMSEILLRKTLSLYGVRSEKEVQEIMKILQVLGQMQMMAMGAQDPAQAGTPANLANGDPAPVGQNVPGQENIASLMGGAQ